MNSKNIPKQSLKSKTKQNNTTQRLMMVNFIKLKILEKQNPLKITVQSSSIQIIQLIIVLNKTPILKNH